MLSLTERVKLVNCDHLFGRKWEKYKKDCILLVEGSRAWLKDFLGCFEHFAQERKMIDFSELKEKFHVLHLYCIEFNFLNFKMPSISNIS
jgi:hypothetical protein